MEGHRRRDGTTLCPSLSGSLPSPPDSPTPSVRSLPVGPFHPAVIPEIVIPDDVRVYRRPNPNWVDPAPAPAPLPPPPVPYGDHESDESVSVMSTVLLDDGSSIKTSDEGDEPTTDDENDSIIGAALGTSLPLASIFCTPKEDIEALRKAASAIGIHTGLMRRPGARDDGKSNINRFGQRENSWWVVMGRNAEAVRHLVDIQQRGMPGFYQPDKEEVLVGGSSSMGFFQTVLAGAIGGAAVLFGMARLL
jgi:hypothetical protein